MKPMSAAIAAGDTVVGRERTTDEALGFAATYFEAYIESRLNEEVEVDFSILGAAAYLRVGHGHAACAAKQSTDVEAPRSQPQAASST